MKNLILIGGPMGAGKSAACRELLRLVPPAAYLDGDWCWTMHPFAVNARTKAMVMESIAFVLGQFLRCPDYEQVIFCWVMHQQAILDDLLSRLELTDCRVLNLSLVLRPEALAARIGADVAAGVRDEGALARSLERLPLYERLDTRKLDVSDLTPRQTAQAIADMLR